MNVLKYNWTYSIILFSHFVNELNHKIFVDNYYSLWLLLMPKYFLINIKDNVDS